MNGARKPPDATPMFCARVRAEQPDDAASRALADIAAERRRQIEVEGWTPEHDDLHGNAQLARAASAYALATAAKTYSDALTQSRIETLARATVWPWALEWWKPRDARSNLVRAGALIVAEIERLDRAEPPASAKP